MEALWRRTVQIYTNLTKWRYTFLDEPSKEDLYFSEDWAKSAYAGTMFPSVIEAIEGAKRGIYKRARDLWCEICFGDCNVSKEDKDLLRRTGFHDIVDLIPEPRSSS